MRALITGVAGQDGTYLAEFLIKKGYEVHGLIHSEFCPDYKRHRKLLRQISVHILDISDAKKVEEHLREIAYDEIYNLASISSVTQSFQQPSASFAINATSVLNFLEPIRKSCPNTRFYQASSSELFGGIPEYTPQNERTAFHPMSPYAVSKLAAHWLIINYRQSYGLHCCAGILFNHESPRRPEGFLTRKVCDWLKDYVQGSHTSPLILGNINARRDWGHAKDFVRAMWMMLNSDRLDEPYLKSPPTFKEYVVGTGASFSIKEFIELALAETGRTIEWRNQGVQRVEYAANSFDVPLEEGFASDGEKLVTISPEFWRPAEVISVKANPKPIQNELGWMPIYGVRDIIREMLGNMN
ncbi:MAG: GDP-mannose 4,6-dehydratase, partial [Planctomycetes bacterium]|nr:GDP-mannose 4,6-dehydratase [Planctomycetota bacterium]